MARNQTSWKPGHKAEPIETPCGPMTRYHASLLSGVAYKTIIRRVWEGCPTEKLFLPNLQPNRRNYRRKGGKWTEGRLTEKWADRKLRKTSASSESAYPQLLSAFEKE